MKSWLLGFLAAFSICATSGANADWQYTRWGMTVTQVEAATGGKAVRLSDPDQLADTTMDGKEVAILIAPYQSGTYAFDAVFSFNKATEKLSLIRLKLKDVQRANELLGSLRTKYGKPESEKNSAFLVSAVWHNNGDQVSFVSIPDASVSITYAPRRTADNEGL